MSNRTVPAAAEGLPAHLHRTLTSKSIQQLTEIAEAMRDGRDPKPLLVAALGAERAAPIIAIYREAGR